MELQILEGKFGYCKGNDHTQTVLKDGDHLNRVVWCSCGKVIVRGPTYGDPHQVVYDFAAKDSRIECLDGAVILYER